MYHFLFFHFLHRWTGSNTNNPNNDGNGQARSDRNNIVQLGEPTYDEGSLKSFGPGAVYGKYGVNYPAHVVNSSFLGLSQQDLLHLAFNSPGKLVVHVVKLFMLHIQETVNYSEMNLCLIFNISRKFFFYLV